MSDDFYLRKYAEDLEDRPTPSPQPHPPTLCSLCSTVDFASYFRDADSIDTTSIEDSKSLHLGSRLEVRSRGARCAFCFLADAAINNSVFAYDRNASLYISRFLLGENPDGEKSFCIRVTARDEHPVRLSVVVAEIQILEEEARKLGVTTLLRCRKISPERMHMNMARNWLDICLNRHGDLCRTPGKTVKERIEPPQPVDLLAIDLHDMCICNMPFGSEFIALSYCWPVKRYLTLLKENRQQLSTRGALVANLHLVPGTVRDAIQCAEELPFRYLWIDALCIVQDDNEHKAKHLFQMDRVYSAASLTIVCAYPVPEGTEDSCSGLPGYQVYENIGSKPDPLPSRSRDSRIVKGLQMCAMSRCADYVLERTRWDTRCWTFQEHHLSRRLLYFTHLQVYWSCSCNAYCEDVVSEYIKETGSLAAGSTTWSPRTRYTRSEFESYGEWALTRAPVGGVGQAMSSYEMSLSHYTSRNVSYPSDILNAFQGVAAVMGESMQSDLWQGLPELFFDQALCWVLRGPYRRRRILIDGDGPDGKRASFPFPTWTWAGWNSAVNLNDYMPIRQYQSEVDWFIVNDKGVATRLMTSREDGAVQYSKDGNKDVSPSKMDITQFLPQIQPRISVDASLKEWRDARVVACWTTSAFFTIDGTFHSLNGHEQVWYMGKNVAIKDDHGVTVGCMSAPIDFAEDCQINPRKFEFILITRSLRSLDRKFERDLRYFDLSIYPDRDWCTLNAMLVQRSAPHTASRFGVGIIHEDAWINARPEGTFIQLV